MNGTAFTASIARRFGQQQGEQDRPAFPVDDPVDHLRAEAALKEMFATDELELCFVHLHSLQNITRLANKAPVAVAAPAAEETAPAAPKSKAKAAAAPAEVE